MHMHNKAITSNLPSQISHEYRYNYYVDQYWFKKHSFSSNSASQVNLHYILQVSCYEIFSLMRSALYIIVLCPILLIICPSSIFGRNQTHVLLSQEHTHIQEQPHVYHYEQLQQILLRAKNMVSSNTRDAQRTWYPSKKRRTKNTLFSNQERFIFTSRPQNKLCNSRPRTTKPQVSFQLQ